MGKATRLQVEHSQRRALSSSPRRTWPSSALRAIKIPAAGFGSRGIASSHTAKALSGSEWLKVMAEEDEAGAVASHGDVVRTVRAPT